MGPHEVDELSPDERGRQSLELQVFTDEPGPFLMPDDAIAQALPQSFDHEGVFFGIIH